MPVFISSAAIAWSMALLHRSMGSSGQIMNPGEQMKGAELDSPPPAAQAASQLVASPCVTASFFRLDQCFFIWRRYHDGASRHEVLVGSRAAVSRIQGSG